jgi:hypothetical protein
VNGLSGILFHVNSLNANLLPGSVNRDFNESVFADRLVVLRNLISLGKIWIKIILSRPLGFPVDGAVKSQPLP